MTAKTATDQTYHELLSFARLFLAEAERDLRAGHGALAQTQIDLAQQLLDLTPMLFRVLNCAAPSDDDWRRWRTSLAEAADVAGWPSAATALEMRARHFLERVLVVRWGDTGSMQAPLPALRRADVTRVNVTLEAEAVARLNKETTQ